VYAVAVVVFSVAQRVDLMVPAGDNADVHPTPTAQVCSKDYACFSAPGYAIDVTIPIIKTGQAENWRPNTAETAGWVFLVSGWFFTGLGWAFAVLVGIGYTGLIRKD